MAHVAQPPSLAAAFNSVFSQPSISRAKGSRSALLDKELNTAAIKENIRRHLKACLGIELDHFIYGVGIGEPAFQLPLRDCPKECLAHSPSQEDVAAQQHQWAKSSVWKLVTARQGRLGLDKMKRLIAEVMYGLLPEYVQWAYRRCYRADVIRHLGFWVRYVFAGLINFTLSTLDGEARSPAPSDTLKWEEIALTRLGELRVEELYDMIDNLEAASYGIEDLRHFITSPATRSYLANHFIKTLTKRLLHPAASTVKILRSYILIIRAFRQLEPKGVLLDRVAKPIRRYLRERDDTVKVVVNGLLSDPAESEDSSSSSPAGNVLSELATELMNRSEAEATVADDELDWDNMDWLPDPVDAAPDYMKSQHTDVVKSLTSMFDSKEVFIKELQTALAERLLKNKVSFDLEISIIDHLESVLGDSALQGCEVMLRDVLDSSKVNEAIKVDRQSASRKHTPSSTREPELDAKILSRLFWPSLPDQAFSLPHIIRKQQQEYEAGFEALKNSRKLTWAPAVGHVEIELQFADRVFADEVLPYQATIIYAFDNASTTPRTVTELSSQLSMSPTLVRSACIFWVSKRVLTETSPSSDAFTVLEELPRLVDSKDDVAMSKNQNTAGAAAAASTTTTTTTMHTDSAAMAAAAEAAAAQAAKQAEEEERKQKMAMYHQFIVSMLTNAGAMQLPRISMMLGMVVPGGFPFNNDELKEFMSGMAKEGVLEVGPGGNWKVAS
ncbi:hypothetical protein DV736_g3273, partial [Chaetothyriales sp. CBS 134916]